ncbi:nucleoporin NDC1 like protein [Danaus plexippus plexippus]|uniref:Nucleoporin NDC1 like protein n=1 Tax=Danaus plexippus plexippus TaxID=278856 RepID=A0A212F399_DANPL|nr:nucleoporin NDC1 like protein [Danaus plexippus plexippus]
MKFPIESEKQMTIYDALSQRSQFTGYLGAIDLKHLSMVDPVRRSQIFTLSQPGGHPRNWNNLLEKCLFIIKEFNKELDSVNGDTNSVDDIHLRKGLSKIPLTPPSSYSGALRNMAQSPHLLELKEHKSYKLETTFAATAKEEFNNFLQKLCQKPGINYFFGEMRVLKRVFYSNNYSKVSSSLNSPLNNSERWLAAPSKAVRSADDVTESQLRDAARITTEKHAGVRLVVGQWVVGSKQRGTYERGLPSGLACGVAESRARTEPRVEPHIEPPGDSDIDACRL